MSVVKINALEIPPQAGDEVVRRFSSRLEALAVVPGFEGFELLRPTGQTEQRWFVYSRWASEEDFQAWRSSDTFAAGHAGPPASADGAERTPVATGSALLEFEVAASADPA
ncbi:MAG: antibiotic biosynthesis monooxygenase [Acidimicrobiales bacterium]